MGHSIIRTTFLALFMNLNWFTFPLYFCIINRIISLTFYRLIVFSFANYLFIYSSIIYFKMLS